MSAEVDVLNLLCNGVDFVEKNESANLYFSIIPPNNGPRRDTVYINVVDVSGSMALPAINGQTEGNFSYSRLDLVKFSLENIVENCEENDYFGLVIFSNNAEVIMPITRMDKNGKQLAKTKIYEQNVQGCTNLYAGILAGLELAKQEMCANKNVSMIVLTDGEANENPPDGVFKTLEAYLKHNHVICSINTLGFGYDIDAQLLYDIALKLGSGTYCFIPDCTMIGTNVTSLIAKNQSCFAKNASLKFSIEGAKWKHEYHDDLNFNTSLYKKDITCENDQKTFVLNFGVIDYGQQRDIVLSLNNLTINALVKAEVTYNICTSTQTFSKEFVLNEIGDKVEEMISDLNNRNLFLNGIFDLIKIRTQANKDEKKEQKAVDSRIKDLLKDLKKNKSEKFIREFENNVREFEGQVAKAFERKDWFRKWGLSHTLYLVSSHLRRFNANFKDPSIQSYGGEIFGKHRDTCENIFCTLQQPKPSIQSDGNSNAPQISIAQACCNISAGCFTGDSGILMSDGRIKKVCELLPGDELQSWNNKKCKITCIIKTKCSKPIEIVNLNGLKITPYHPVYTQKWEFPLNIAKSEKITCNYIYNLVVDCEHVVIINGIKCVTLGHEYQNDVVAHPYFGSQNVINDLKKMKGWENGLIRIECLLVTRDENTGLINSMIQAECNYSAEAIFDKCNRKMEMSC